MTRQNRIVVNPEVMVGKPVIKGTRITVEFVIDLLAHGWKTDKILKNYPGLQPEDVRACLIYASGVLHAEKVYPLPV
jgi:uncharacterized protein (DUF433 family)